MDYDTCMWGPSSILDEFQSYFEEDLFSFISDPSQTENEVRITEAEQLQDYPACNQTLRAMGQFDRDAEPIDFGVDGLLAKSNIDLEEENSQTVNPADLIKGNAGQQFLQTKPETESPNGISTEAVQFFPHAGRTSTLSVTSQSYKGKPQSTTSQKEKGFKIGIVKFNSNKRNETKSKNPKKATHATGTQVVSCSKTESTVSRRTMSSYSDEAGTRPALENFITILNFSDGKGIRKRRNFTPEEKKRINATRNEGACLRCRRTHKTCIKNVDGTGVCKSCIVTSKKNPELAKDMCMKLGRLFLREEFPDLELIYSVSRMVVISRVPGHRNIPNSDKDPSPLRIVPVTHFFSCDEIFCNGFQPQVFLTVPLLAALEVLRLPLSAAAALLRNCSELQLVSAEGPLPLLPPPRLPHFHYFFDSFGPPTPPTRLPPPSPPLDWRIIPPDMVPPSYHYIISRLWQRLEIGECYIRPIDLTIIRFGKHLDGCPKALELMYKGKHGRTRPPPPPHQLTTPAQDIKNPFFMVGLTIELFVCTLFKRNMIIRVYGDFKCPESQFSLNHLLGKQLNLLLIEAITRNEAQIFARLRTLAESDRGGSPDNYIPLFTTLCILFSVYSRAALNETKAALQFRNPLMLSLFNKAEYIIEGSCERRAYAALRTCKELATLYLAIFQKMGPFTWKTEREWRMLEQWLEGVGFKGEEGRKVGGWLREFVGESWRAWKECQRWRPGLPFCPAYIEDILRY